MHLSQSIFNRGPGGIEAALGDAFPAQLVHAVRDRKNLPLACQVLAAGIKLAGLAEARHEAEQAQSLLRCRCYRCLPQVQSRQRVQLGLRL